MVNPIECAQPWAKKKPPKRILVMRFQAIGDVVITLPYLQDLKDQLPEMKIDFLTREEASMIPSQLAAFSRVIIVHGGRNMKWQLFFCLLKLPWLWWQGYDAVIDLQNHRLSRIIRRMLFCGCWSQFDRSSLISAGERTRGAIRSSGISDVGVAETIRKLRHPPVDAILRANGWQRSPIIVLNPAGGFESRNWPLEFYISFARLWAERLPEVQFLMMGLPALSPKASYFKLSLEDRFIDLTGKTTLADAYEIINRAMLVVSEDSGLMHMAWTQHVPTIAIFGSTPAAWSAPLGPRSFCFNSSDLPCGSCFQETCRFGDNHCLTRWSADIVFRKSISMLNENAA